MLEEKKYYSAKYDRIFKTIMIDEENPKLLEALLSTILEGEVKIISFPRTEGKVDTTEEKVKTTDLVIELNGKYINLEVETGNGLETRAKNFAYLCSMYKTNIIRNERYATDVEFIQIILQYNSSKKYDLFEEYLYQNENHVFIENVKTIEINMEKIKQIWYDNITKDINKYKYLIMLDLEKEELEKLGKEDSIVQEFKSKIFHLNENERFVNDISKEEEQILLNNTAKEIAYQDGISKGITQGEHQKQLEIAKEMVLEKMNISLISKITKLPKSEIQNIYKNLNSAN